MLHLFKKYQPYIALFVALYALLLYSHLLVLPSLNQPPAPSGILGTWIKYHLAAYSGWSKFLGLLLITGQALLINYIVNRYKMLPNPTYFPAVFYVLVMGFFNNTPGLNAVLLANTFFIIALWELYKTYREHKCASNIFNVGFWIAVGSLCYLPVGMFMLLGVVGLLMLRSSNFNDFLILFIGCLVPYFLVGTGFFLFDSLPQFLQRQFGNNLGIKDFLTRRSASEYVKPVITVLAIIGLVIVSGNINTRSSSQAQKNYKLLFWALGVGGLSIIFQLGITTEHLILVSMPLGILFAALITRIKNPTVAELVHLALLIAVLAYQYRSILV